ncbi:MAG: electron transfer flavoprotein subunit alpha/FixB family protein [Halobacteriaceae archaeon]
MTPDVLAIAEHRRGELRDVSFELITAGRQLANDLGGELHVAIISGDTDEFTQSLDREGVDHIHVIDHGEEFNHDIYAEAVSYLVQSITPQTVLAPNSVNGLDYVPALANELEWALVTDATEIEYEDGLVVTREMYGSKVETTLEIEADQSVLSIRSGEWPAAEGVGSAEIERVDWEPTREQKSTVKGYEEVGSGDVDISEANFLISIGRGIEEEENLALIRELVEVTGATMSASRPIVDNGWLPKNRQVGQSGKQVTPDVYLAIGISGAVQHVAGMKGAETIIAINTDPNAPIFDIADVGIVGDLFDVVPALIEEFGGKPPSL